MEIKQEYIDYIKAEFKLIDAKKSELSAKERAKICFYYDKLKEMGRIK